HHHVLHPFPTRRSSDLHFATDGKQGRVTLALTRSQVRVSPEFKTGEPIVILGLPRESTAAAPAASVAPPPAAPAAVAAPPAPPLDRKSTRLNSSHDQIS